MESVMLHGIQVAGREVSYNREQRHAECCMQNGNLLDTQKKLHPINIS